MENQLLEALVYATNNQLSDLGKGDRLELTIDGDRASIQRITPAEKSAWVNKVFILIDQPLEPVYVWVSGFVNALSF